MLKQILILSTLFYGGFTQAKELSDKSLVTRSLTAKDGEFQVWGAAGYTKKSDNDNGGYLGIDGRYGITDDWSISLGHTHYRFIDRGQSKRGLELAIGAGLKGAYELQNGDDVIGYGADITGKYVFSNETAVLFGSQYVFWNVPDTDKNLDEWRWSIGMQQEISIDVVLSANYTYRDLNGFNQSSAYDASIGFNYALTKQWDLGISVGYSDFNALKNGFKGDTAYKENAGIYVGYRF